MKKIEVLFVAIILAIIAGLGLTIKHPADFAGVSPSPSPIEAVQATPAPTDMGRLGPDEIYPPASVPGAINTSITQATIGQTICNKGWSTKSIRPSSSYTTALKKKQMIELGLTGPTSQYEEDHLISLELGGNPTDPKNLWPEDYTTTIGGQGTMGARQKDQVENYLHAQVCAGSISLEEAQREISTDWYAVLQSQNTTGFGSIDTNDK